VCDPVLIYGVDRVKVSKSNIKKLDTTDSNIVKQVVGLSNL